VNYKRNEKFLKAFGKNVRRMRKEKGLTMEALAYESEMEIRQLGRIENGEINTTISTAYILATALGVGMEELFKFSFPAKANK
jgi:transcriptional regulator with XRE-family HTH domain